MTINRQGYINKVGSYAVVGCPQSNVRKIVRRKLLQTVLCMDCAAGVAATSI